MSLDLRLLLARIEDTREFRNVKPILLLNDYSFFCVDVPQYVGVLATWS